MRFLVGASLARLSGINAIAHGNSWVANFEASDASHAFVQLVGTALGITISNQGVGSQTITNDPLNPGVRTAGNNMVFTAPTAVDPLLTASKLNVLFTLEDINSAVSAFTGQQLYDAWAAYHDQRKAAAAAIGAKVHICHLTSGPAGIGVSPDFSGQTSINNMNAAMIAGNALVAANPRPVCDSLLRIDQLAQFVLPNFTAASFIASGIYFTDNVHPIDPGHALIANLIVAQQRLWRRMPVG